MAALELPLNYYWSWKWFSGINQQDNNFINSEVKKGLKIASIVLIISNPHLRKGFQTLPAAAKNPKFKKNMNNTPIIYILKNIYLGTPCIFGLVLTAQTASRILQIDRTINFCNLAILGHFVKWCHHWSKNVQHN